MSSFTFSDNRLGGRLTAACDAIGAGHLRRAAGIFNEVADDLNAEAEVATGLLSEEVEKIASALLPETPQPSLAVNAQPVDLQMCARNVHSYGAPDSNGWRHCQACGVVNVSPPENNGFVDMSARR